MSDRTRDPVTTTFLAILVICAVAATAVAVRRSLAATPVATGAGRVTQRSSEPVPNWASYVQDGHRLGPADAKVTILEFADFECPICRRFERGALRAIRAEYPRDVAVVFRHWPLPYHKFAYVAARAAECAGAQGRFEAMHDLLYEKQDSLGLKPFVRFASDAGVKDTSRFAKCVAETQTVAAIDRDSAAAREIKGHGTPTLVIGGVKLGFLPDSVRLDSLVRAALAGR